LGILKINKHLHWLPKDSNYIARVVDSLMFSYF
jgi:hypothetical protein